MRVAVVLGALAIAAYAVPTSADAAHPGRSEVAQRSGGGLALSYVRLRYPMLEGAAPHPAACDEVGYLRYRWARGPKDPQRSRAVIFGAPGAFLGGYALDRLARNTLRRLAAAGRRAEWWTYVPRSVCAFDTTGLDAAYRSRDYHLASDYYFGGKPVDGRRFAGFPPDSELRYFADMGAAQFAHDLNFILTHELPDPAFRRTRAFCGGHSDGGLWFGVFAAWDFGGGAENAGYNQCAGFFAVGSLISADWAGLKRNAITAAASDLATRPVYAAEVEALKAGLLPQTLGSGTPVIDPAWWTLQAILGNAAYFRPHEESDLGKLIPSVPVLDQTARLLFSRTHADLVSGENDVGDFRFTNEALLGVLSGDQTINFADFAISMGALCGGPVAEKEFPWPNSAVDLPLAGFYLGAVSGATPRVGPTDHGALYRWCNYDRLAGVPFARADQEVVDVHDYARQLAKPAPGFLNPLMPNRWSSVDQIDGLILGTRSGDLAPMRYDAEARSQPIVTIFGTDDTEGRLGESSILPPDTIYVHGYTHWDPPFGAARQSDGKPEPFSDNLARFFCAKLPDGCPR